MDTIVNVTTGDIGLLDQAAHYGRDMSTLTLNSSYSQSRPV